mgnify:CR=1 FL=1
MKLFSLRCVAVLLPILFGLAGAHASERGALPVEVFDVQSMDGASVSSDLAQQADGRLLVANMRGLFRFDGARWQLHVHPEAKGGMEHLAIDADGRIHTSFNGDIGWWADDDSGTLQWHSVLHRLPDDCRDVAAETMSLHWMPARGGTVYAAATRIALVPDDPRAPVLCRPMRQLVETFVADGDLLATHGAPTTLSRLDAELAPVPVPGSALLDGVGLNDSVDSAAGTLLLNNNGQVLRYRDGVIEPWSNALFEVHGRAATRPFRAIELLADGRVVVAGLLDGVFVLDANGRLVDRYDERDGVPVRRKTNGLHTDSSGDLWLAQERTLARIGASTALTVFDDRHGLPSAAQLARWQGALWVASRSGLFQMRETSRGGEFHAPLPELLNLYGVAALGEDVLLVADGNLHVVRPADAGFAMERLPSSWNQIFMLEASRFVPGRAYAGYAQGLLQIDLAADGGIEVTEIGALKSPVLRIAELDADTLWVADRVDGVLRVELADPASPRRYGEAQGLPAGTVRIYSGPRQAWFTTLQGLRVYDAASDRFLAPPGLPAELQQDRLYSAYEDHQGHLWVRGGAILNDVFWREGAGWRIDRDLLHGVDPFPTIFGFHREEAIVWAIRANGLLRIDLEQHRPTPPAPAPLLTQVYDTRARSALPHAALASLPAHVRDLRIDYALPVLRRGSATTYRSRLAGFEEWTEWTASGQQARIYTNLPDGKFQFEVEARDALQRPVSMPAVALAIAPPWFRTPLALGAYLATLALALYLAAQFGARRRQRVLLARQQELELEVSRRTEEIASQATQLREQATRLTEMDRLKTQFFVNIGHEFRTPLTLVLGPLDDVLSDARTRLGERTREQLELALRNARRVLDLIVELLDVNRMEHGHLPLKRSRCDLRDWLRTQLVEQAALVERHGHRLQIDIDPAPLPCDIDPAQLARVIGNLLGNAAKYMQRGGDIEVRLTRDDECAQIDVRDHGCGIAEADLPFIFDRFHRIDERNAEGFGVGLALAREIVERHGGTISAQSTPGQGSTLSVRLPRSAVAAVAEEAPEPGFAPAVDVGDAAPAGARERPLVLIVDDHADLRLRLGQLLQSRYQVIAAEDGPGALALAQKELPDVIVSDVMMPGFDGVELTRRLRAHPDTRAIGVLLLTAKAGAEHAVIGLQAGANDYLAKPFDAAELLARVGAILAHARRLQTRLARAAPAAPTAPLAARESETERWMHRLEQHINAHLHDSAFDVEALAQAMHMDRSALFRHLKQHTAQSPAELLRERRLLRAQALLQEGAGSVTEVAFAVGFDTLSGFTRAFRAQFGRPPSEFLAAARASA